MPGLTIVGRCGQGGFADVFEARDGAGRTVAVKLLRRAADARADREVEVLGSLSGGVAPALAADGHTADGRRWLAMEHLGSDSLAERLAGRVRAGPGDAVTELRALAAAVDALHAAGIAHRDLKPENLFFCGGAVRVIDFGLARRGATGAATDDTSITRTGERMGTLHYMAPEQWDNARAAGPAADRYAAGVIAFEILTGRPPFAGDVAGLRLAHATARVPDASALAPLPRGVDAVLARAMAKAPTARFPSVTAMVEALAQALARTDALAPAEAPTLAEAPTVAHAGALLTALVALRTDAALPRVSAMVRAAGGVVGAVTGSHYVIAIVEATSPAAGLRAARALADEAARTLDAGELRIHAAELRVVRGRRGPRPTGAALDPSTWPPATGAAPALTPDAARLLARTGSDRGRELELAPIDADAVALVARDELLDRLVAQLTGDAPTGRLATILGEPGMGKSRVLAAAAQRLRAGGIAVHCVRATSGADSDALVRQLLALGSGSGPWEAALAGLGQRAPGELPAAARLAAELATGLVAEDDPRLAALLEAPGALRQATARAVAAAIRAVGPGVLMVDDAHRAPHAVLDGIELATMTGAAVCVAATPALADSRAGWGNRAGAGAWFALAPLPPDAARAALTALLHPIEFVPGPVLDRLVELAGGVPANLVELARAVREAGVVRTNDSQVGYYVAADELLAAAARPLAGRLGDHVIGRLPQSLVPLARACAVLGERFTTADLEGMQAQLADGDPLRELDAAAGLARLGRRDVVRPEGDGWAVRSPLLVAALSAATPRDRARSLHRAAHADLEQRAEAAPLERIARHAAGAGRAELAAQAHAELADRLRTRHDYARAEEHYSQALEQAEPGSRVAGTALAGRGQVRYRMQRFDHAIADLRAARAIAEADGERTTVAHLLLEEATALDWCQDNQGSRALAERANQLAAELADPALAVTADLAMARSAYRDEQYAEAAAALTGVAARAQALQRYETRVIALLLLGPALTYAGEQARAEEVFDEVVALCTATGDDFHLAAAHTNRQMLWIRNHDLDRAARELAVCVQLSRELGNAQLERAVSFNLAELELWRGDIEAAMPLARRARELQLAFVTEYAPVDDALLLARLHAARAEPEAREAEEYLDWITRTCDLPAAPPSARLMFEAVSMLCSALLRTPPAPPAWRSLAERADREALTEERIEIRALAATAAAATGAPSLARAWIDEAMEITGKSSALAPRLAALAETIPLSDR